jgi:hypothetical protein
MTGDVEKRTDIHWNCRIEEYFANTAEKAHCHKRSEEVFSCKTSALYLSKSLLLE